MIVKPAFKKCIALYLLVQFSGQTFLPTLSYALTSGPSQPEFSSFEPVSVTNMVDEFTGDFTYNLPVIEVPGPNGSSYPLSLSYHSGVTPEEEASWVGYGWTLNPGAINRQTRGIPDDFNGKTIHYHNKMPKNWTATVGGSITFGEVFSTDLKLGFNASLRYNNYRGFGYNAGMGLYLGRGIVALGYHVSDGEGSFSLNVNPTAALNAYLQGDPNDEKHVNMPFYNLKTYETRGSMKGKETSKAINLNRASSGGSIGMAGSSYGIFSYNDVPKSTIVHSYSGGSYLVTLGTQTTVVPAPVGATGSIYGSYAYQENTPVEDVPAYGYLYSDKAATSGNTSMDYHVEKETSFNKRDVFLGIPFNDADNFMVSGEGIGGGFRLYNKNTGHFGPRSVTSGVDIRSVGGEVAIGWSFGAGVDIGSGSQSMTMSDWRKDLSSFASADDNTLDEPVFFRFNNDLGGEWGYNHNDNAVQASISGRQPDLSSSLFTFNNGERAGRSSLISYTLNKDMVSGGNPTFKSFNKNTTINGQAARTDAGLNDLIGEIAVVNESGTRYLYALPVHNRNEKNLSYGVAKAPAGNIRNNFIVYNYKDESVKVGQEQDDPYASTYLLTEITSPDYIDRSANGPTLDDLGGYTRFNYYKHTGSDWYNWRAPYRGLIYNKNSHSDPKDEQGSYSEGEKQIYYVHSVETRTHVAIFTFSDRADSREAPANALPETGSPGSLNLKKLDRIDLYSLNDCQKNASGELIRDANGSPQKVSGAKAIKTVHFKYNYSLCSGLPNSTASPSGKLTLERVHFEYNELVTTRISPYVFYYAYPDYTGYPAKYKSGQEDVTVGYSSLSAAAQNPAYNPFLSDSWGNYQANGTARFAAMQTWMDQNAVPNQNGFDPAAWHLKRIKLPSGGEIHVQYDQDDYAYVQDQEAHVMASLAGVPSGGKIYINPGSAGVTDVSAMRDMIQRRYVTGGKKIYFKFLYTLIGSSEPNLTTCNADFITGYVSVLNCDIDAGGLFVTLNGKLPEEVCREFVKTQRLGMLDPNGNCVPGMNESSGSAADRAISIVNQLHGMAEGIVAPENLCGNLSPANSYLRVPVPIAKQGGGLRVKRLLMYDSGIDGNPVLYGNEYLYETWENGRIISSGVATNEPQTAREENILVDFVARKGQNLWSKIIAGKDKKQSEGPIGESVLQGPSVGYARVTVRNIHSGETNPGFSVSEFFTAKDFPVSLAHPDKAGTMTSINAPTPDKVMIPAVLVNIVKDRSWASQGFSFVLNNMHGQAKRKASYTGPYDDAIELAKSTLVSSVAYEYFKPGEKVPMMSSLFGEVTMKNPGREVDLTFAQKKVEESSKDANIEGDLEIAIIWALIPIPLIWPTAMPSMSFTEGEISTHATSKVVRYPAILKKTTVYQDGILHTEENVAFDTWTGRPVAVKSQDEFKGAYLAQNIPASWEYQNYTPKYVTEGKSIKSTPAVGFVYTSISSGKGYLSFAGSSGCSVLSQIATGDVLDLGNNYLCQVSRIDYTRDRAEVVQVTESPSNSPGLINEVKIVRSGRTNELTESAGDVTFHSTTANSLTVNSVTIPESQRYVSSGSSPNDGSLFIKDLNDAFINPALFPLDGPYHHMNLSQYIERLPEGCAADLSDASVKNVFMRFKTNDGNLKVELGTFDVLCGSTWETVKMPNY